MTASTAPTPDVSVEHHGTIFLVRPLSQRANAWIGEHIAEDAMFFGGALVVEYRYVQGIVAAMMDEGMQVQ
jgi:hypothetical protein